MRKVVGLDISLKKIAVCVLDRDGQLVWQGKVDAEPGPLTEKLRLWRDEIGLVGLEACPLSEWLHRHLIADGFNAVCVETRQTQRFLSIRPVKTDRNDARGIAEMMRIGSCEIARGATRSHHSTGAPADRRVAFAGAGIDPGLTPDARAESRRNPS
jgi:transposase